MAAERQEDSCLPPGVLQGTPRFPGAAKGCSQRKLQAHSVAFQMFFLNQTQLCDVFLLNAAVPPVCVWQSRHHCARMSRFASASL